MKKRSSLVVLVVLVGLLGVTKAWQQTQKPQALAAKVPAKPVARRPALVLNEGSATALIKEALQNERYMVSTAAVLPLMSQSTTDYTALDGENADAPVFLLMRLIGEGFVKREVRVDSYPVISGSWSGADTCVKGNNPSDPVERLDFMLKNKNNSCSKVGLTLQLQMVANSNRTTGTSYRSPVFPDPVNGTITPEGKVTFDEGDPFVRGSWTYIERDQHAYLVKYINYLYSGTASGKRIEVKTYKYAFIPALGEAPQQVPAGRFEVGAVSNLLLTIETRAAANFTWRVSLDGLGHVMLEKQGEFARSPGGIGRAEFAKKPDGTWVLVPPLRF